MSVCDLSPWDQGMVLASIIEHLALNIIGLVAVVACIYEEVKRRKP